MPQDLPCRQEPSAGKVTSLSDKLLADGRLDSPIVTVAEQHKAIFQQ